jgi:hypothetical protein
MSKINPESTFQINETTDKRIFTRNIPSHTIQPYFNVRPASTKYTIMPIVEPRKHVSVPLHQFATYDIHNTFNPGNDMAPWSGFASNVNVESELRNQIYALQSSDQSIYVPSSHSDLYKVHVETSKPQFQPYPQLFQKEIYNNFNPNSENVGKGTFYNHTRQQLKDN